MQDASNEVRRVMQQFQVRFDEVEVLGARGDGGPEDGVVVWEEREHDTEEEGGC